MMEKIITFSITVLFVLFMAAFVYASMEENKRWEAFKITHSCKIVSKIDGEIFNTISVGADGKTAVGIASTPNKTGWLCDDGVTYVK